MHVIMLKQNVWRSQHTNDEQALTRDINRQVNCWCVFEQSRKVYSQYGKHKTEQNRCM